MNKGIMTLEELHEDVRNLMMTDKFKRPQERKEAENDNRAEEKKEEKNERKRT